MDLSLRGKRAVVTGASKGIGAAIAEVLAEEGCNVILAARNEAALTELAARLRARHQIDARPVAVDLRTKAGVDALAGACGDCDVLVNNAGDIRGGSLDKVDGAMWRHDWDLKVFGFIDLSRHVYAAMKARGSGAIVNIIGAAGEKFDFDYIAGTAGNAALMAFTRALGSKSLADNIRVVGINPGPVETDRIVTLMKTRAKNLLGDEARYEELLARMPRGRAAKPREIADMAAFLASERSAYTTGVIVTIDGGISAGGP